MTNTLDGVEITQGMRLYFVDGGEIEYLSVDGYGIVRKCESWKSVQIDEGEPVFANEANAIRYLVKAINDDINALVIRREALEVMLRQFE